MNYGLYLSASGVLSNLYRQDVFANNLANVNTVGFKPDVAMIRQRGPESIESDAPMGQRHRLLDRLGGGVFAGPQHLNMTLGNFTETGGALDAALSKPNAFFVASVTDPSTGVAEPRLTRDGRFLVDPKGYLVTASGGHKLLSDTGGLVQVKPNLPVQIGEVGQVLQGGEASARIRVVTVSAPERLVKEGANLLRYDGSQEDLVVDKSPRVLTGFIESSAVDPIKALLDVINATKSITSNSNMIRYHDLLMDRAVNVLGRVQA